MTINQKDVITILGLNPKTHSQLETMVLEYGNLHQKMNDIEQQTWFFKKAEENNRLKLKDLKNQLENIRNEVNYTSINDLIESLNDYKEKAKSIQIHFQPSFNKMLALASFNSSIIYIEEILSIKSRVDEMKEIEYYLENKESFIKLLGW